MIRVADGYRELLDATIRHLQELQMRGVRYVSVSEEVLAALQRPVAPARAASSAPPRPAPIPSQIPPPVNRPSAVAPPPVAAKPVPAESPLPIAGQPSADGAKPRVALSLEAKTAAFAELRQRALGCQQCPHLAAARKHVVFGVGTINAELMFIGEAPGADEDEQGEPFVGKAGQLLTKIIQTAGLTRETVYIANILKCRPDTPGQSAGNRKPTPVEMQTCIPFLHEQIDLIGPKVIVALGATAVEGLLGKTIGITRLRGHWQTYRGIPLMPTYHPAYLLRNQALSEKRRVWEDMLQVMERLQIPISEKQRNYFLRSGA